VPVGVAIIHPYETRGMAGIDRSAVRRLQCYESTNKGNNGGVGDENSNQLCGAQSITHNLGHTIEKMS